MVRIAAAQMQVSESMEKNYQKSLRMIEEAAANGAKMVCFPEGQLTHYIPQYKGLKTEDFAIGLDHPYVQGFCDKCRDCSIIGVISLSLVMDGKTYPCMLLIDENGKILEITKKKHIVYAYHFYEQDYYTPAEDGFRVVDTSIGKVAMIVCFDRHFPESWRTCALKGADFVVTAVANEKIEPNEVFQWEIRIPAFQSSMHTLSVNRVGVEGIMDFCGESVFCGPHGNVIAIGDDTEQIVYADLDFDEARAVREEKQYMKLRRPEVFELGPTAGSVPAAEGKAEPKPDYSKDIVKTRPMVSDKVLEGFKSMDVATVHEAMGKRGAMTHDVKGIDRKMKCCGRAFTVKCHPGDNIMLIKAASMAATGDVIVGDMGHITENGPFGEIAAIACQERGVEGLVVSCSVRDTEEITELGFPVFSTGVSVP